MNLCICPRALIALLVGLATLVFAPEAWAHGSHHHRRAQIEIQGALSDNDQHRVLHVASIDQAQLARRRDTEIPGNCGASACCGSVCVSCCSLLTEEVNIPAPATSAKRFKLAKGPSQSGLGSEQIRRPPKN
jgi:hypothetical protein